MDQISYIVSEQHVQVFSTWVERVPTFKYMLICCCCWVASVVSDSVRPHRRQPTRLPRPWDSPGKNTGVGFRFLLQCMKVRSEREVAQPCPTLSDPMDCSPPGSSIHGIFQARVLEWGAIAHLGLVIPVVMYGCESWTVKKTECRRIDAFELWCWRRLLRVPWTSRRSNQSILKEISPEYSYNSKVWPSHAKNWLTGKDPSAERMKGGEEGDDRGWDG